MAIITTRETINDVEFTYTRSDSGFFIRQDSTGIVYCDAYDLLDHPQTYTETDELIPDPDYDPATEDEIFAEAGRILLGVEQ